jgi:hypothetical protein
MVTRTPFVDVVAVGGADPTGATDSTAAINACIAQYGAVSLPPGIFTVTGNGIPISNNVTLFGAGQGLVTIRHSQPTGNALTILGGVNSWLSGFTIDRAVPAIAGGNGIGYVGAVPPPTNNWTLRDLIIQNHWIGAQLPGAYLGVIDNVQSNSNYSDGWDFNAGAAPLQWNISKASASLNNGWGYQFAGGPAYTPVGMLDTITTFANALGGMSFNGSPTGTINDVRMLNYNGSGNGGTDLNFQTYGEHCIVGGAGLIEGAGMGSSGMCGRGLLLKASGTGYGVLAVGSNAELTIVGQQIRGCANSGIGTRGAFASLIIANNQISSNNQSGNGGDGAIFLTGTVSNAALVTGNGGEDRGTQRYGIYNGMTGSVAASCNALRGTITNYGGAPMVGVNV